MKFIYLATLIVYFFLNIEVKASGKPYHRENRISYIENSLKAFQNTTTRNLTNTRKYIVIVDRNNCRSNLSDLRVACLLRFAKDNCKSMKAMNENKFCGFYSDIMIVNQLSENLFISRAEQYQLLKDQQDKNLDATVSFLQQKYARLATLFSFSQTLDCQSNDLTCLSKQLDNFCLNYSNQHNLSWQYCVAAIVDFIGMSK